MTTAKPEGQSRLAATRHAAIVEQLRSTGQVSATDIAEQLGVTHETIRKDLTALQERGVLRRVHGGAVPVEPLSHETMLRDRSEHAHSKARIAEAALAFLPDSGAVLLDSGSTTAAFAERCPGNPRLLAMTNSLPIASSVLGRWGEVILLGGRLRPETEATAGQWTIDALASVTVDVAFLGTNALSLSHGLATPSDAEAALKAAMVRVARLRVLLADSSKIGRESVFRYAELSDIDVLISDNGMSDEHAEALTVDAGIEVIRV